MGPWLYKWLGLAGTGAVYAYWSGFGSDLGELTLLGTAIGLYKMVNCREHHCWRLGFHRIIDKNGAALPSCRKHHPHDDHTRAFHFAEHPLTAHHFKGESSGPC